MRLFFATAALGVLALAATSAAAQEFPVHLQDGASWTITAEHTRSAEGGGPAQNWNLTTVKRLTWHAPGADGKPSLTVTPLSATPGPNSPPEVAQARSLAIPATVAVGPDLSPGDVLNREEVRAEFRRLVPGANPQDTPLIDVSAKVMIAAELATVSRGQALGFAGGRPIQASVQLPNPLGGGPPLRATQAAQLESFDRTMGIAKVRWSQALDPESFKSAVAAMLAQLGHQKLAPARLAELRTTLETATYANTTDCSYVIDIRTGLANRAQCATSTHFSAQGRSQDVVEAWTITQTTPDAL
jgi:hypothetical protein